MKKTLHIVRNEIVTAFSRKSFLFTAFGLPLIAVGIFIAVSIIQSNDGFQAVVSAGTAEASEFRVEGYVDHSGLIIEIDSEVPDGTLVAFSDAEAAHQALKAGEIDAYYVIPADYVESGDLIYINPDHRPLEAGYESWAMRRTIFNNLLGNNRERIDRAWTPMDVQANALADEEKEPDEDSPLPFFIPYATMMVLYLIIIMSATLLLNSIGDEKKSRVMEILLVSVTPQQMLAGKIIGLGILGLLQAAIWVGTGYALLRLSGRIGSLPPEFELPVSMLAWVIVFFLLGYAVYASLMAGLGALAPNLREASQATIVVIWPMLIPMFFFVSLIEDTHGAVATALSLFPLTAPVAMITRLVVGGVPSWQPLLAAGLLLVASVIIIRSVAAMFHAQTLLSGQPVSVRQFYRTLLGRPPR
jgi:ABC-2 type transport system permease protein